VAKPVEEPNGNHLAKLKTRGRTKWHQTIIKQITRKTTNKQTETTIEDQTTLK
jgi:hypothetical protein